MYSFSPAPPMPLSGVNAEVAFHVSASERVSLLARCRPVQPFPDYGEAEAAFYAARRVGSRLRYPTRVQP